MNFDPQAIRAVLFDVDGTLYDQGVVRRRMMRELLGLPLRMRSISKARGVIGLIRAYRHVLEELRSDQVPTPDLASIHLRQAAQRSGYPEDLADTVIEEWMAERPLQYLASAMPSGLQALIRDLVANSMSVGFFSDYPLTKKLRALGLGGYGSVHLDAQDAEVGVYKPHTRGFLRAAALLDLPPASVLYVGDRPAIDGQGALAAGMSFLQVSGRSLQSFAQLRALTGPSA